MTVASSTSSSTQAETRHHMRFFRTPGGADGDEVTYKDIVGGEGKSKPGYRKLSFCAKQASSERRFGAFLGRYLLHRQNKQCGALRSNQPHVPLVR
jgi:hypothetical protein